MVGRLADRTDEAAAVQACRSRGLAVSPLGAYYLGTPRMAGLVMGFAGTPAALATDTARRLEAALRMPLDSQIGSQPARATATNRFVEERAG